MMRKFMLLVVSLLSAVALRAEVIAYLPLNSGTAVDASGLGAKVVLLGSPKFIKASDGNWLNFAGGEATDGVAIKDSARMTPKGFGLEFEASFNPEQLKNDLMMIFSSRDVALDENAGFTVVARTINGKAILAVDVASEAKRNSLTYNFDGIDPAKPHRYGISFDGEFIRLWIDGLECGVTQFNAPTKFIESKHDYKIGTRGSSSYCCFGGNIRRVVLYDSAPDWAKIWNEPVAMQLKRDINVTSRPAFIQYQNNCDTAVIDGKLDDAVWQKAQFASGFGDSTRGQPVGDVLDSRFAMAMDGQYLYFAATGNVDDLASMKTKAAERDGAVYNDECFDLNIYIPERKLTYQFVVNPSGMLYDGTRGEKIDPKWNSEGVKVAARTTGKGWETELAIPLQSIGLVPGADFKFNVGRNHFTVGGSALPSAWLMCNHSFGSFERMGLATTRKLALPKLECKLSGDSIIINGEKLTELIFTDCTSISTFTEKVQPGPIKIGNDRISFILRTVDAEGNYGESRLNIIEPQPAWMLILDGKYAAPKRNWIYGGEPTLAVRMNWIPELSGQKSFATKSGKAKFTSDHGGLGEYTVTPGSTVALIKFPKDFPVDKVVEIKAELTFGDYQSDYKFEVVRVPQKVNQIYADSGRILIDDGKKVLPFGTLGYSKRFVGKDYHLPRNFIYNISYDKDDPPYNTIVDMLDDAAKNKMKIAIFPLSYRSQARYATNKMNEEDWKDLESIVNKFKNHPGLLGWYLADEPHGSGISLSTIAAIYKKVSELDPNHPGILLNNAVNAQNEYGIYADILCPDPYPLMLKTGVRQALRHIANYQGEFIAAGVALPRPTWMCLQLFDYAHFDEKLGHTRMHDFFELRTGGYLTLANGGTGFSGYVSDQLVLYPVLDIGYEALGREIAAIKDFILDGNGTDLTTKKVFGRLWQKDDDYLLIAVNRDCDSDLALDLSTGAKFSGKLYELGTEETINMNSGRVSFKLQPVEARVFTSKKLSVEAIKSVEARIATAEAKIDEANRHNLIYWKNGGSVKADSPFVRALDRGIDLIYRDTSVAAGKTLELNFAKTARPERIEYASVSSFASTARLTSCVIEAEKADGSWVKVGEMANAAKNEGVIDLKLEFDTKALRLINKGKGSASFRWLKVIGSGK
jgi:hypothetical protein